MPTLTEALSTLEITYNIREILAPLEIGFAAQARGDAWQSTMWEVIFTFEGRSYRTHYRMGISDMPRMVEVLDGLLSATSGIEWRSFDRRTIVFRKAQPRRTLVTISTIRTF